MNSLNSKNQRLEVSIQDRDCERRLAIFLRSLSTRPYVLSSKTGLIDINLFAKWFDSHGHSDENLILFFSLSAAFLTQTVQLDDSTVKFEIWVRWQRG